MSDALMPYIWVTIAFLVMLAQNRWIHTHLHGVSLLLTAKPNRAVYLYAFILFPGVLLHEFSHWLAAKLLGVRTGGFSVLPQRAPDGSIQLGYVEYYRGRDLGPMRESLVGGAPLIAGTAVILLISFYVFDVTGLAAAVGSGDFETISYALEDLFQVPYILLWVYLLFAIGNAMLPSPSDRRAWPAFLLLMALLAVILAVFGWGNAVIDTLAQPSAAVFGYLATAFSVVIGVNLFFMLLIFLTEYLVGRLRGVSVVYGSQGD